MQKIVSFCWNFLICLKQNWTRPNCGYSEIIEMTSCYTFKISFFITTDDDDNNVTFKNKNLLSLICFAILPFCADLDLQ